MDQSPAHLPPSTPPISIASVRTSERPSSETSRPAPSLCGRLPLRYRIEFSFDMLFIDNDSDLPESPRAWLKWMPPLASTLHQLSLTNMGSEDRRERALQAIRGAADPCAVDPRYRRPVLHWACLLAHPDLVALLLQHGASAQVNQPDGQGRTPLDCVQALRAETGAAKVASVLLSAGATTDALPQAGAGLLYLPDLDLPLVQRLLRAGVPVDGEPDRGSTPLVTACGRSLWAVALVLLEAGADVRPCGPLRTSVLHHGDMPVWLAEQLQRRGADVNARDLLGETPLMLACAEGNTALARWLIAAGAQPEDVSDEGLRAIDHAQRHVARPMPGPDVPPAGGGAPTEG